MMLGANQPAFVHWSAIFFPIVTVLPGIIPCYPLCIASVSTQTQVLQLLFLQFPISL